MATVSERSREILEKLRGVFKDPTLAADMTLEEGIKFCDESYAAIIEQALLAERRLAMEEAADMAEDFEVIHMDSPFIVKAARLISRRLRAAAEKEVGK